jgi:HEAT repeat protein
MTMTFKSQSFLKSSVLVAGLLLAAGASAAKNRTSGRAEVYKQLAPESLEDVSNAAQIIGLRGANVPATRIWKVLEHGEKLECLACIPVVSELLYDEQPKTREISAWWLRRRIFGVFGPGQVYEQTIKTLSDAKAPSSRRLYAANALGEFLSLSGVPALSQAVTADPSPGVRVAAVSALERLNSSGSNGELTVALGDGEESVRLAALRATSHINAFTDVDAVVALIGDPSALVRRRAAETLGVMKAGDALVGLIALTSVDQEPDAKVRAAAIWALGQIGDSEARDAILAAQTDADPSVRSAATISGRMLRL